MKDFMILERNKEERYGVERKYKKEKKNPNQRQDYYFYCAVLLIVCATRKTKIALFKGGHVMLYKLYSPFQSADDTFALGSSLIVFNIFELLVVDRPSATFSYIYNRIQRRHSFFNQRNRHQDRCSVVC